MSGRNRTISVLLAVCYTLAVTVSALFHDHDDACGGHSCRGDRAADHRLLLQKQTPQSPKDAHQCSVCQFLAEKTLAAEQFAELTSGALAQEVVLDAQPASLEALSLSWHSRAPPDIS